MQNIVHKLSAISLPWPTDWEVIFGTQGENRPLILEIGFGQGEYLRHLSATHPDANIVGIEISHISMTKAEKGIAQGITPNVRVVFTYAETALQHLFEPESLDAIHINYPDPWFKSRHEHRRLMKRPTVDAIVSRLKPGGMLYVATDIREYAEMTDELLRNRPGLTNQYDTPWVSEIAGRVITKYERIARKEGRPAHYFVYARNTHPAPDVPTIKDLDMPNLTVEIPLTPDEIMHKFERFHTKAGQIAVNYRSIYRGKYGLLVEIYASEPTIEQQCSLLINQKRENPHHYTIRPGAMGNPRPTEGMHLAVRGMANWLIALHDEGRILHDKIKTFDNLESHIEA